MAPVLTDTSPGGMLRAIEADLRAAWTSFGAGPGCELLDSPSITRVFTDMPQSIYNAVVYLRAAPDDANGLIQETLAYFGAKRVPSSWWLGPLTQPADYDARLRALHPASVTQVPGMAMDLTELKSAPLLPPDVAIHQVTDDASLRQCIEVDFDAFGFKRSSVDRMLDIDVAAGYGSGRSWRHFMASRNGQPLGNTSLFAGAGVAGLYGVATLPEARRQGIATALVIHALQEARQDGYRIATLQSSEAGFGVYRRIGFHEYCHIALYEWHVSRES